MADRKPSLTLLAVSLPLMFVEVSETVVHLIDTLFLARVGQVFLGAIAIADVVLELTIVVAIGLVEAVQIVVARRVGEERLDQVGEVFDQGLLMVGGASLVLTTALFFVAPWVASALAGSAEVATAVTAYL